MKECVTLLDKIRPDILIYDKSTPFAQEYKVELNPQSFKFDPESI
jgi:hypothetical protein